MTQKRFLVVRSKRNGTLYAYSVSQIVHFNISFPKPPGSPRVLRVMHEKRPMGEPQVFDEVEYDISDFLNELQAQSDPVEADGRQVEI